MNNINCVRVGGEYGEVKDKKWSLASLNPLSWLFSSKSELSNTESRGAHLPISRRAGLSDIKNKKTYNDIISDQKLKGRRKRRRKQSSSSLQGPWKRNKSNPQLRERQRRRRKQQAAQDYKERKVSHHVVESRFANRDEYEDYYDDNELALFNLKQAMRQDEQTRDLVMSDYDSR